MAEVQELLFNLDYLDVTDGYYWESTRDAVKLFQAKHGLPADGMVGPATYQALTSPGAMKKSDSAPGPVKLLYGKSEGYLVIILQDTLTRLHYYSGPVSGQFDYATYRSVREFQQYNGLKVDGVVGPQTWAKINDPSAVPKP